MGKILNEINEKMDLNRTDKLFDISIENGQTMVKKPWTESDVKIQRVVVAYGNLHINSAKVKLGALRLIGYGNQIAALKKNMDRKIRDSKKYKK